MIELWLSLNIQSDPTPLHYANTLFFTKGLSHGEQSGRKGFFARPGPMRLCTKVDPLSVLTLNLITAIFCHVILGPARGLAMKPRKGLRNSEWDLLYRTGAIGAWFSALFIPIAIVSHLAWPPPPWAPGAASDWFAYLQNNPVAGLLNLDFALEIGLVASIPLYLALYVALKQNNPPFMLISISIAFLGILLHLLSNSAWEMLLLSNAHAVSGTEAERNVFLAAGEARLSVYYGMVFQASYVLGYLAYLMIGSIMRRSEHFGKGAGNLAIAAGIGGFGFYLPAIGALFSVLVVILIGIWNVVVGWILFRMPPPNGPSLE